MMRILISYLAIFTVLGSFFWGSLLHSETEELSSITRQHEPSNLAPSHNELLASKSRPHYNKSNPNEKIISTTLDSMCDLERVNPFAAQQEYSDKIIEVQEYIGFVTEDGLINIENKSESMMIPDVFLDCAKLPINQLAKLRPNQKINVQGEYKSMQGGFSCIIHLKNCVLKILDDVTDHSSLNNTGGTTATGLLVPKKRDEEEDRGSTGLLVPLEQETLTTPSNFLALDEYSFIDRTLRENSTLYPMQAPDPVGLGSALKSLLVPLKKAPPTTPSPFTSLDENAFLERTLRKNSSSFPIASHSSTVDANPFLFIILVVLSLIAGYWNFYIGKPLPLRPELIRNPITNSILALCSIATGIVVILIFIYGGFITGLVAFAITAIIFWFMKRVLRGKL